MESNEEIDEKLICIISCEIHRDGGASLARDLKDYARIDSLLKRCSKTKLLGFLQQYPEVFQVNREVLPHTVYLLSNDYVNISRGEEKEAYFFIRPYLRRLKYRT